MDDDPIPPVNPFFRGMIFAIPLSMILWSCICLVIIGIWGMFNL